METFFLLWKPGYSSTGPVFEVVLSMDPRSFQVAVNSDFASSVFEGSTGRIAIRFSPLVKFRTFRYFFSTNFSSLLSYHCPGNAVSGHAFSNPELLFLEYRFTKQSPLDSMFGHEKDPVSHFSQDPIFRFLFLFSLFFCACRLETIFIDYMVLNFVHVFHFFLRSLPILVEEKKMHRICLCNVK